MIGLLADTHDNMKAIGEAVDFFNLRDVSLVLHAGDLISPFTAREFRRLNAPFRAVYGNNEGERDGLREKFKDLCNLSDFIELEHNGKRICVYHGTIPFILKALEESQIYDLVVSGHTHNPESRWTAKTLMVNPGECCGYLTGKKTIALVDSEDLSVEFVEL